ncbi:uncharacterized protein N7459_006065 [Penicillium hispanicum]|uniref:uncharacterized protein n=1 Tax=Penicillium hispanicum TaxID=1080232 RepID=UPI0025403D85|nr:uncharacterized protein N7459_006065 [Penicillium hispanicum]KAJ5580080.1 hypothetical protein N7459_006065 [Penicillium hispanicum]
MASFYHLQSMQIPLRITSNFQDLSSNGGVLAAICLLRLYKIISRWCLDYSHYSGDHQLNLVRENLSSQSHLQGCHSFLADHPIKLQSDSGLVRAAFWAYLREDITVALVERRKLMIELPDFSQMEGSSSDFVHADPIDNGKAFPFIGTLHGWHADKTGSVCLADSEKAAAWQYYQTAVIVHLLARPTWQGSPTMNNIRYITSLTRDLEHRAAGICEFALSSEFPAVWVNAFWPYSFLYAPMKLRSPDLSFIYHRWPMASR